MRKFVSLLGLVAVLAIVGIAYAEVTLNPDGTGFVGKGDVQLALGLNNKQLQDAVIAFTYESKTEVESTWTCTNLKNENTQERARTTTTTTAGVLSSVARERNQITGFNLQGYAGGSQVTVETEGPKLWDCPTDWAVSDQVTGDPVTLPGGLYVNGVLLQ
jgi:hypothetical protein